MTEQQFCYWLQGFAELTGDTPPTAEQWAAIREHLGTCFHKVTVGVVVKTHDADAIRKTMDRLKEEGGTAAPGTRPADAWPPRTWQPDDRYVLGPRIIC